MDILLATNNKHKVQEIKDILNFKNNTVLSLKDVGINIDIKETGKNYYENAKIKALAIREKIKDKIILSDDSGLEIKYLNNAPGLHSARFLKDLSQKDKNLAIIKKMENIKTDKRAAKFVSVVCCILPDSETHFFDGKCEGHITEKIYGDKGFGYDPIFVPSGFEKSFGQLSQDIKNSISHRYQSFIRAKHFLVRTGFLT